VNLTLAIVFLWLACACFYVAFHPLTLETATGHPGDVVASLRTAMQSKGNAYKASA
jgi:hypothetical protein